MIQGSAHIISLMLMMIQGLAHIYTKQCQSPWFNFHGDIISSKLMTCYLIKSQGKSSHLQLMIQDHEAHRRNFGSHGLEGQEVSLVKLQQFKVKETCCLTCLLQLPEF